MSKASAPLVPALLDFESRPVRTVEHEGAVWFVGKDVCDCLGIVNHRQALRSLHDDERKGVCLAYPLGGSQVTTVVAEAGVWRLVFKSRVEAAERFKRWLAHDVLPALRREGRYEMPGAISPMLPGSRDFAIAIQAVREARLVHGKRAAVELWNLLGLPVLAPEPPPVPHSGPVEAVLGLAKAFLAEAVRRDAPGQRVGATALWQAFQAWAAGRQGEACSRAAFGKALTRCGLRRRRIAGRIFYERVQILSA